MLPEDVVFNFIKSYNEKKFSQALNYTLKSIFPGTIFLKNLFQEVGKINNINLLEKEEKDKICIIKYRINDIKEGYILLFNEKGSWYIVTEGKDKKWLMDFGEKCVLNFKEKKSILTNYIKYKTYKIDEKEMDKFFKEVAEKYPIILFGVGVHHSQEAYTIFINFVKYLNKFGYHDIFIEDPWSFTWFSNRYLQTGDIYSYRMIGDEGNFFRELYKFNIKLPQDKKIRIWSIDVDYFNYAFIYQIEDYINGISDAKLKEKILRVISPFWTQNREIYTEMVKELKQIFKKYRKKLIKETNEKDYKRIWTNMEYNLRSNKILSNYSNELREEFLKQGFKDIYTQLLEEGRKKVVGLFGNWHTAKRSLSWDCTYQKFGECLDKFYKNSVFSINMLPYDGKCYKSIYTNEIVDLSIPKGSIEDIYKRTCNITPGYLDLKELKDYIFYDRAGYFISSETYDAIIFYRSSLPFRPNLLSEDY